MNKPNSYIYDAQFFLDKEKDKTTSRVRFRVKWEGGTVSFLLGYRVEINKWSVDTQKCINNSSHGKKKVPASFINKRINKYLDSIDKVFIELKENNIKPNKEIIKAKFNERTVIKPIGTVKVISNNYLVQDLFSQFMDEESVVNQWTLNTIKKMRTLKKRLYNFNSEMTIDEFDQDSLLKYQLYLQSLNFQNSTIKKKISHLKWFLRWAEKKNYLTNNQFKFFRPRLKSAAKQIIFLNRDELTKIINVKIPKSKLYLERVRDVFLFQCFTGLRYSDVENLRKSDIKHNRIEITTVKTTDNLVIELNKRSKEILDKYQDFEPDSFRALPVITNQKMNEYLKELAQLADISEPVRKTYFKGNKRIDEILPKWQVLTSHAGRRTFICNALSLGIPPQVVMKWTGHSDYRSMKPYIDVADNVKSSAMQKFDLL